MTTTASSEVTTEDLLARVRALLPGIRERAQASDANRTIPAESAREFVEAGLPRVLTPRKYGGYELGLGAWFDLATEIGTADGAHAWCASLYMHHPHYLAQFPEAAREHVWRNGPDELIAATLTPTSRIEHVDGGYRISCEIPYLSAINHASWVIVAGIVIGDDGPPTWTMFLVGPGDFEIEDTWHVAGMRGTGSNTVVVKDVFVPVEHTATVQEMIEGTSPHGIELGNPVYRAPWAVYGPLTFLGPMLGAVRGALESYRQWNMDRDSLFGSPVAKFPSIQYKVAEVGADLDAAELLIRRVISVAEGESFPTEDERARSYRDQSRASQLIVAAADTLMEISGAGGFADSNPIQRAWRDVHFAASHVTLNPQVSFTAWGKHAFGLPRDPEQKFY